MPNIIKLLFVAALWGAVALPAFAQTEPAPIAGCPWKAAIEKIGQKDGMLTLAVTLLRPLAGCGGDEQGGGNTEKENCAKRKDIVYVQINGGDATDYEVGQKLDVWVSGKTARLDLPQCVTDPVENDLK